jgi:hypothetical protein
MAAAAVGGAALLVRQYFKEGFYPTGLRRSGDGFAASGSLLRAMIVAGADPLNCFQRSPSMESGHGSVNLDPVLRFDGRLKVVPDFTIESEDHFVWSVAITEGSEPLRVAIAYLDAALGAESAGVQNDVDLFVTLPNGSVVYGNMRPGWREERFSTVERIILWPEELQAGTYVVHVVAHRLVTSGVQFALVVAGPIDAGFPFQPMKASLERCPKGAVGLHCQIKVIVLKEVEQVIVVGPASVEYIRVDILPNDNRDVFVMFVQETGGTFSIFAQADGQPTVLGDYEQHWEHTEQEWSLYISSSVAAQISYVGMALVNLGRMEWAVKVFVRLDFPGEPTETSPPTAPSDYYLAMVVGYVLVGMLLPIVVVLAVCLWISRWGTNRADPVLR